jgi:hypothetical protein
MLKNSVFPDFSSVTQLKSSPISADKLWDNFYAISMYVLAYSHSRKLPIAILSSISYDEFIENRMFQIKIRRSATGREG